MAKLEQEMQANQRVLLVGPPGCGKTARVLAAAKECGRRLVVMRVSLCERVDFGGCLVPDMKTGVTRALPLELLHELKTTEEPTLLFLDDMCQPPVDVQAALMRLFDDDGLSKSVLIWGATNRPGDKAGVTALAEPLRSRFDAIYVVPVPGVQDKPDSGVLLGTWQDEIETWIDWAESAGAAPEILAWHRCGAHGVPTPGDVGPCLYGWKPHADPSVRFPDYRTWGSLIVRWNAGLRSQSQVCACLGKQQGLAFLAYARMAESLPAWEQVVMDPAGSPVPKDASAQYLAASLFARSVEAPTAGPFIEYVSRMGRVVTAFAARSAYKRLGSKLSGSKAWVKWFLANKELFETQ